MGSKKTLCYSGKTDDSSSEEESKKDANKCLVCEQMRKKHFVCRIAAWE